MTWFDKSFLAVYFLLIIIVQSIWQHRLIKANKPIKHGWHGVYYALSVLPMLYFFVGFAWQVVVIAVVTRLAWFDICLNWVRGKRPLLTYNGKGTTGSIIDKAENALSQTWLTVLKLVYIAGFVIALIKIK